MHDLGNNKTIHVRACSCSIQTAMNIHKTKTMGRWGNEDDAGKRKNLDQTTVTERSVFQ